MARTVEIVYPVCCGIDVHKSFIVACVAVTDEHSHTEHHIKSGRSVLLCQLLCGGVNDVFQTTPLY